MEKTDKEETIPVEISKDDKRILTVFSVNWIELEILKILNRSSEPVYKGEMISVLRNKHDSITEKPESSFYAIFDKLEKSEFIKTKSIPGQGYKTFLEITEPGQNELNRALYWGISSIFEGMLNQLISVLNDMCVRTMGCLKEMNYGVISPNNPEFLVPEMCNECVSASAEDTPNRFNILMPYSKETLVPFYQNLRASPDNIPLKMDFLDRVNSILTLGFLEKKDAKELIKEVHRILKPGAKVAFYEILNFESYLFEALRYLTHGFQIFTPKKSIGELKQFDPEELKELVSETFGKENVELIFLREIILVIAIK
ncbi:MAG: hypothetical protein GPJ51_05540 [Candidatus Heimdallarchaeota archaeon]|nr:hypothetical protein [Candidatus Heimdallarchaeota archaeon]